MSIFDDLEAELDRIEEVLAGLDDRAWTSPSAAEGWSIADVVLHLAQTEEAVVATTLHGTSLIEARPAALTDATTMDEAVEQWVAAERDDPPAKTFERWRQARRDAVAALRSADPDARLPWAAAPLKPAALATTRLAEHWAHALDIVGPLGVDFPDTDRLRHIAWLAHRTLPYGFALAGQEAHDVRCELSSPDGTTTWTYGDDGIESVIRGSAGDFCRVGAQRLAPEQSDLTTSGPYAEAALRVLRNYAG